MNKTQNAAMTYAEHYMNRLLDIEDRIGQSFEQRIEELVERKLRLMAGEKSSENNK